MVQAYRLLVAKLKEEGFKPYPLHLGVTEAGEAEDGRIKSAVGIGTLLEDGLGDTVRVSLTEQPEFEIPVARNLVDRYNNRHLHRPIQEVEKITINPYQYHRRETNEVLNLGSGNVPRVIADYSRIGNITYDDLKAIGHFYFPVPDKWNMNDLGADYIYTGSQPVSFMLPNGLKEIIDAKVWDKQEDTVNKFPVFTPEEYSASAKKHGKLNFLKADYKLFADDQLLQTLKADKTVVCWFDTNNTHAMAALRRLFFFMNEKALKHPVIITRKYEALTDDELQLFSATDIGGLLIDGFGDGVMLDTSLLNASREELISTLATYNSSSFGILQAARTRMSKTEYISCPSCGRTLFDLQETTAMIRKRTDHLKGVKIGIMGCIVNGPGEMADADYGYVGVGKDKIALYRGQTVVNKAIHADKAVDQLIEIIKEDGRWLEPVVIS